MIQAHSGYVLPLPLTAWSLPWGELGGELGRHAFHHSHPNANANFGGYFNWWDRLMGTDKPYLAWVEEKRRERERGGGPRKGQLTGGAREESDGPLST